MVALGLAAGWSSLARSPLVQALPTGDISLHSDRGAEMLLPGLPGQLQEVTVWLRSPERAGAAGALPVRITLGDRTVVAKALHNADPDVFVVLKPSPEAQYRLSVGEVDAPTPGFEVAVTPLEVAPDAPVFLEAEPNDRPEEATPFRLGSSVFASADDRPFIRAPAQSHAEALEPGVDWFTFRLDAESPRLVFLWVELLDREVPVDVDLFQLQEGKPVALGEGFERFEPENSTRFVGMNKFIARRLDPGVYHLQVRGNHPAYQLRSEVYPLPPFDPEGEGGLEPAARNAVKVATDYILLKGDSWHANTPRVGGVDDRILNVHAETAQCLACHPTHFSTRSGLLAAGNGYPVRQRASLRFLTERLYSNPRPLYGHPQAVWSRMISASANVLSRLSFILNLYEHNVSSTERTSLHRDVAEYLKLYYGGRDELPPDESNGNLPLVSGFEVAFHSWAVFDELYRRTGDDDYLRWRERVRALIATAPESKIQDMLDLCYQTIAFSRMDPAGYEERIATNVQRIFSYQRPDGQWPMGFGKEDPPAEFQTAHALYTLALAGVSSQDPRVERGVRYLLSRQYPFGGWYDDDDPNEPHPYENFGTPFRETQFAIMALSQLFPGDGGSARENPFVAHLDSRSPLHTLESLDQVWDAAVPMEEIVSALGDPSVLVRQRAAASLGRVGDESAVAPLVSALEDPSKLVQRASAWALRQLGDRNLGQDAVARALRGDSSRQRRAALQVLAQHHRYWVPKEELLEVLIRERMADPDPYVRLMASRVLWQWWYFEKRDLAKSRIEDVFLQRMGVEDHPWVLTNLKQGFYNICDENTRYLYNNWVALLGREADRERATAGHHDSSRRQAEKIAEVLKSGSQDQVAVLLDALGRFHLRTGTYERQDSYHRIGNDVETIQFYGEGARILSRSFERLFERSLEQGDAELRRQILLAGFTLRKTGSEEALGLAYLRALGDSDERSRQVAREFYREFLPDADTPGLLETLIALLDNPDPEVQGVGLDLVGDLGLAPEAAESLAAKVELLLLAGDPDIRPHALKALIGLPSTWRNPSVVRMVAGELKADVDWDRQRAALYTVLRVNALNSLRLIQRRLDALFTRQDVEIRQALLKLAATDPLLARNARIASLAAEALGSKQGSLRSAALDLVRRNSALQANAAVRDALAPLLDDPNFRTRQIAESIYTGETVQSRVDISELLNYEFFKERVQPVFFQVGPDGKACVECHHNHGILKLTAPEEGPLVEELSRANYRSALKVVDLQQPERSLILAKPVSTSATEGIVDAASLSHGGAVRWPSREESSQYNAILEWINGGRTEEAPQPAMK